MAPYDKGASSRSDDRPRHENGTPASRSPKHRGHRAPEEGAPRAKNRWDASDRRDRAASGRPTSGRSTSGRSTSDRFGSDRSGARRDERGGRPNWEPRSNSDSRGRGRFERDDRRGGGRPFERDDRGGRSFGGDRRDDRPAGGDRGRSYDRDRAPRSYDRDDRPQRSFGEDRGGRSYDRNDRAPRSYDRNDRAPRSHDRDDRPQRSFGGDRREDRPRRQFDDRAPRSYQDRDGRKFARNVSDRGGRSFDRREDRPKRSYERDERDGQQGGRYFGDAREDRPAYVPVDDVKLEKLQAEAIVAADVDGVSFGDLGIGGNITRVLTEMGATSPFPIQAATIPDVLAGKDVLGRGKTGSGKTIAFGAPLVEKLMENNGGKNRRMGRNPRALILAPTRELALQIDRTVQPIARSVGLFTTQIYGGVPQGRQVGALQRGVDIVVGTPGRIEDLMRQGRLDLSEVVITVLDEADHMCDLGFLEPVQRILEATAEVTPTGARAQKLLFSATLDTQVASLVDQFLVEPAVHEVLGEDQASSTIDHRVLLVEQRDKDAIIEQLAGGPGKTVVFARTRAYAERLADQLEDAGIRATSLHGDLNQSRRTRNLSLLTTGRVNVLVATDVAARGIHVDDVSLVIQADAPDEYKTYMHRSGRTGRAGKEGTVVTLIPRGRRRKMEDMLDRAEIDTEMVPVAPGDAILEELAAR